MQESNCLRENPMTAKFANLRTSRISWKKKKKPHVVILTSAVTVGSDIRHAFSSVFVDFRCATNQGCSAQNIFQMIGRFRNVRDPKVRVLYSKPPTFIPCLLGTYRDLMTQRREQFPQQWRDFVESVMGQKVQLDWLPPNTPVSGALNADGTLGIHISPSWFSELYLLETVDQKQNQDFLFWAHARQSGWKVIVDGPNPVSKDPEAAKADALTKRKETTDAKRALANEQECLQRKLFEELQRDTTCHTYHRMNEIARLAAEDNGTSREMASVAHVLKHFVPLEPDVDARSELQELIEIKADIAKFHEETAKQAAVCTMTFEDFQAVAINKPAIWSLAKHQCEVYTEEDQVRRELKAVTPFFDITCDFAVNQRSTMTHALKCIGIDSPNPFTHDPTPIPLSMFAAEASRIVKYTNTLCKLRGKTAGKERSAKQKPGMYAKARLSTELCHMHGTILKEKRGTGNVSVGYLYVPDPTCLKYLKMGNFSQLLSQQHRRNRCSEEQTKQRNLTRSRKRKNY